MHEFLTQYALFAAEAVTIVVAIAFVLGRVFSLASRQREPRNERITIRKLNKKFKAMALAMKREMLPHAEYRRVAKAEKAATKAEAKAPAADPSRKRLFVLDFMGDIKASAVTQLREEITAVLTVATPADEVVVRLESAGGLVHAYGLAASQLQRVRDHGIPLTVSVDKVAASGGYMMACVADRVLAAPFAVLGSIGVVAQVPNFHRLLKSKDIDFEQFTAGEFKRTITMFGENTDKARAKFKQDIEDTHGLFKDFVAQHRAAVDIESVATGEHWYGTRALELRLVDRITTSDDYLLNHSREADLFEVRYAQSRSMGTRLSAFVVATLDRAFSAAWQRAEEARYL